MKYLIDHNLPAQLAHAIRELCSHDKSVEVYALTDKFPANAKDADWITALAEDGDYNLVRWWPSIMKQADMVTGGSAFRVKWAHGAKAKFEQIRL